MSDEYDAKNRTRKTLAEAEAAVGKRARLPLTGTITEAGTGAAGAFVRIELDARWGFPEGVKLGLDLDALEIIE